MFLKEALLLGGRIVVLDLDAVIRTGNHPVKFFKVETLVERRRRDELNSGSTDIQL